MSFWIVTDAACDLPKAYVDSISGITVMPMYYRMDGIDHPCTLGDAAAWHPFYEALRNGKVATTAQVSTAEYQKVFRELTEKGEQILCIVFSSGLSGTYQAALLAQEMILEENPGAKILVVDSLCASAGQGLFVHYAIRKRQEGLSLDETAQWLIDHRQQFAHWFTVDDLSTLKRGGRVSATAAFMGSMLKIKPILHVNYEGKLIPREKVQGRKKSLKVLAEKAAELAVPQQGQTVFIGHGDCEADAEYTLECMKALGFEPKEVMITAIGAIIGAHSGPGTLAVFFLANER
uniref:Putative eDD domain protein DegV family n=1 Tax=uncultured bacterium Ad_144_C12_contig1 TaxID=1489308 RepID=A0A0B4N1G4_9BACT|nr:putative eDD domain protein DegV family [uncultured bacterium Ad_144_C12_contig1]